MEVTKKEARAIAKALREAAEAIDAYLDANFQKIGRSEYEFLNESFKTLLRVSSFTTTIAVGLAIDSIKDPADLLQGVIEQIKDRIHNLETVGRVINLVAALVDLGAGITAKDPKAVSASVTNLVTLINS